MKGRPAIPVGLDMEKQPGFTKRAIIAVALTLTAVILIVTIGYAAEVFLLTFTGILFAIFLTGVSHVVERHTPLKGRKAVGAALGALLIIVALLSAVLVPVVSKGVDELSKTLPQTLDRARQQVTQHPLGEKAMGLSQRMPMGPSEDLAKRLALFATSSFGALGSLVVVFFLGLYFAFDPELYRKGILRLIPTARRKRGAEVLASVGEALLGWLTGKLIGMAVVGVVSTIGLMLLGVPLAPVWGILAGLLEFIPNIGPVMASIPAILFAFAEGPERALYVALLFIFIQTAESYLLEPLVQKRLVSLPPALLLFSQLLFGVAAGFLGLFLATPLMVAIMVLVQKLYVEDALGDEMS